MADLALKPDSNGHLPAPTRPLQYAAFCSSSPPAATQALHLRRVVPFLVCHRVVRYGDLEVVGGVRSGIVVSEIAAGKGGSSEGRSPRIRCLPLSGSETERAGAMGRSEGLLLGGGLKRSSSVTGGGGRITSATDLARTGMTTSIVDLARMVWESAAT